MNAPTLHADVARCPGYQADGEWREGCEDCLRRTAFAAPSRVRRKRDPGRCYLRAGFRRVGVTKGGLITLQLLPYEFQAPQAAISAQAEIEMAA